MESLALVGLGIFLSLAASNSKSFFAQPNE